MKRGYSIPYMEPHEISVMKELIGSLCPKYCLEWGIGGSTLFFTKYLNEEAEWIGIEHNLRWFRRINSLAKQQRGKIQLHHIAPNRFPWTDDNNDGSFSDLKDYVEFPERFSTKFDLILIDGRARASCIKHALKYLSKRGVVIVHDAKRPYYHDSYSLYNYDIKLYNSCRKGIFVGCQSTILYNYLDVQKHILLLEIRNSLCILRSKLFHV